MTCNIQKKDAIILGKNADAIIFDANAMNNANTLTGDSGGFIIDENVRKEIAEAFKALEENEIKDITFRALLVSNNIFSSDKEIRDYDDYKTDIPMGTYFWDEFSEYEAQYNLTDDESKLLGIWMNVCMNTNPYYRRYVFSQISFLF
jgi:hypothetical protein